MSRSWAGGSTWAWRKLRRQVLTRDRWRCRLAITGLCVGRATVAHHVRGKATGDNLADLVAACAPCNARVNDPARVSTHQRVVAWVHAQGAAIAVRAMVHRFPEVTVLNMRTILRRAVLRGELINAGRGLYRPGSTDLPPVLHDPPPRPRTRW